MVELLQRMALKMNNIPKRIFLQVGDLEGDIEEFDGLYEVTWSAERIYDTDIEYILKPAKAKKSVAQMAKETNGRSRACKSCQYLMKCTPIVSEICSKAFVEGYTKGYKQGIKG